MAFYFWKWCSGWLTASSALFICGMSEGEEPALQGLATSLIDRAYHARLFTSVAVVEILAKLVGGPMMGKLFSIGQAKSSGICFSVSAVSLTIHSSGLTQTDTPLADHSLHSRGHCMCTKGQTMRREEIGRLHV